MFAVSAVTMTAALAGPQVLSVEKATDETALLRMYGRALDLTGEGDRISKVRTPRGDSKPDAVK